MSWLLCCVRSKASGESCSAKEQPCAIAAATTPSSKATTGNSLSACLTTSLDQVEDPSLPQPLMHAPSSRVRKASQHGLRLSEDTLTSALSTTPTSLNPLAYVFPFVNDDNDDFSTGHTREEVDAVGATQPRSKVEFADLCGSLEDLAYLGEGSNGVVYSASWHGARVAVKFLLGSNDDGTYLQRCLTEAVLTRVLSHPCVVQCFATAISQLTPEVWESIRARCQRHASILQSSSLGRSVAAAVLQQEQQEQQERTSSLLEQQCWEQQQQQLLMQGQQQQQPGDRRQSLQNLRSSQSSLPRSHQSPRQTPPQRAAAAAAAVSPQQPQQQQQQPASQLSQPQSLSHSQAHMLVLPSADRLSAGRWLRGGYELSSEAALLELQKMTTFFAEDLHPQPQRQQPQQPQQRQQLKQRQQSLGACPPPPQSLSKSTRPCSGGIGCLDMAAEEAMQGGGSGGGCGGGDGVSGGGEGVGIGLMQALLDLKAEAGRHCTVVVMEYMDAGTLHQAIMRGDFSARRSSEHRVKLLALLLTAQELAQGMAHLHGLDILHGDLKPTNVLLKGSPCHVGPTGGGPGGGLGCSDLRGYTAKIADLGLARPCSGETAELSSDQWGALAYLAPEAAKGSCCKASDVYSFGVMLWEMSAGVRPYLGLTTPQVLMGLITGQLQLTWPSDGSLYAPLRSLAIACTDFNPKERPTFEVAARILGRMVRHIRSAAEPLRQRHSSALSMEAAAAAAAAAAASAAGAGEGGGGSGSMCLPGPRGGGGGSFHLPRSGSGAVGGGGGGMCVLNHASRSMPIYLPTAAGGNTAAGALPSGEGSEVPRVPVSPSAVSAAVLSAASKSRGGGGGSGSGPSATVSSGGGTIPGSASAGATGGGVAAGCVAAGTFWTAAAAAAAAAAVATHQQPLPYPYPRTRRAAGGGLCGAAVVRSPLGGAVGVGDAGGGGMAGSRALPSAPCGDPRLGGQLPQASATVRSAIGRPGSSPAHTHVATMEAPRSRSRAL